MNRADLLGWRFFTGRIALGGHELEPLPPDLMQGRGEFLAWRGRARGRGRIPLALWAIAVRLAKVHGVGRTAKALGLDLDRLKARTEAPDMRSRSSRPVFVELPSPFAGKSGVLEFDNGAGVTLRVQLVGYDAADLEALSRGFWNAR
jgi:hypothetical protein